MKKNSQKTKKPNIKKWLAKKNLMPLDDISSGKKQKKRGWAW